MLDPISYAGPGGRSVWVDGPFGAGCLYPIGTARESLGSQPVTSECGRYVSVANVRLDARNQLERALGLSRAERACATDPMLLLKAWLRWGHACGRWVYGDYSFVVYDRSAQTIFGVTDFPGANRLFHARLRTGGHLLASDEASLLAYDDPLQQGWAQAPLTTWLLGCPQRNRSIFSAISVAACGELLELRGASVRTSKWWSVDRITQLPLSTLTDYAEAYRQLLTKVVTERTNDSRAVVCELSGGIDSSSVAATLRTTTRASNASLTAITHVYPRFSGCNDAHVSAATRDALGLEEAVIVDALPLLRKNFHHLGPRAESPNAFSDPLHELAVNTAEQRAAESIFVGFGGDEITRGRLIWSVLARLGRADWTAFGEIRATGAGLNRARSRVFRREVLLPIGRMVLGDRVSDAIGRNRRWRLLLSSCFADGPGLAREVAKEFRDAAAVLAGNRRQREILRELHFTPTWYGLDAYRLNAAAKGISVHAPLLDRRIVEFSLATPADIWYRDGWTKYVVRRAFSNVLPSVTLQTKGKVMVDEPTVELWSGESTWAAEILAAAAEVPAAGRLAIVLQGLAGLFRSGAGVGMPCAWFGTFLALWLLRHAEQSMSHQHPTHGE